MGLYDLYIRRNLGEPNLPLSLVLPAVPRDETTDSVAAEILWRWEDEPEMKPEPLGSTTAGNELVVPFDLKGRSIRVFVNSRTKDGNAAFANVNDTEQIVFNEPTLPVLAAATFDAGTDDVTLTIANNGGGGNVNIFRKIGTADFALLDTVSPVTTSYIDEPVIDGTYQYKLTQDGLIGESNTRTVEVDVDTVETGSPPDGLSASYDELSFETTLNWTNNGGTGLNIIERTSGIGFTFSQVGSVAAGTATFTDSVFPSYHDRVYYYRVRNESVSGYSNEADIYVPRF